MKKCNIVIIFVFFCIFANFLFLGCKKKGQNDNVPVEYIKTSQVFHINKTENSPSCKIEIKFGYLKNNKDSIATIINQNLIDRILGKEFYNLSPQAAVDSFKNSYIDSYKNEVGLLFEEDTNNGQNNTSIPSWYNYKYKLSTDIFNGKNNIICAKATIYEYTGGAHPNEWGKWLNLDTNTGKIITLNDIFLKGYEQALSNILLKKLTDYISNKYKEAHIDNEKDFNSLGILSNTDMKMYISDNYILGKDNISFLYNKYDLAPYSASSIILSVPYEEVKKYMLH